jgi:cob(I)alamin adenosyltransferase
MKQGFVHIYTGKGKGKTTAAVGLSVRARSRGLRVLFAQFMKNISGGEVGLLRKLGVEVMRFERVLSPLFHPDADRRAIREEALKALHALGGVLGDYDLVVLDEFNYLLSGRLITAREARDFIAMRPENVELVLTGRGAPRWLIAMAGHVTEMRDVEHPARHGVGARRGIEY